MSALWLAGASALTSVLFYIYGAQLAAVIELSVGAGLVTVLFVFAINIAGDDAISAKPVTPWAWVTALVILFVLLLGSFIWFMPFKAVTSVPAEAPLSTILWQARGLDLMVQIVLIYSGVLGLLGLLAEAKAPLEGSMAAEVAARRDLDMLPMQSETVQFEEVSK